MTKISLAILTDPFRLAPWQVRLIEQIKGEKHLQFKGIVDAGALPLRGHGKGDCKGAAWPQKLLAYCEKLEGSRFVPRAVLRCTKLLEAFPEVTCIDIGKEGSGSTAFAAKLKGVDLVLVLVPIAPEVAVEISNACTVWALAAGEGFQIDNTNFGFREMFGKNGISRLSLVEVKSGACNLIAESFLQIQFCYSRNKAFLYEKSVVLILRELRRLSMGMRREGAKTPIRSMSHAKSVGYGDIIQYAGNFASRMTPKVRKAALRKVGAKFNRWSLFVGRGYFRPELMSQAQEISMPTNEFWADPFLFQQPGKEHIDVFYEAYEFSRRLGKISVGRLNGDRIDYLGDVLIRPYHLSYPFVFAYDNEVYMIPETAQNRQIEILKAENYPLEWSLVKTALVGQSCADTTIFEHKGEWWMFTNIAQDIFDDHCSELHAFKVDSPLLNEITPHKLNPIVTDARTARNAGRIAVREGKLTRLAQNNAFHYGYGFSLMEIEELSLSTYREKKIYGAHTGFAAGITATHQMDQLNDIHIFDGLREFG